MKKKNIFFILLLAASNAYTMRLVTKHQADEPNPLEESDWNKFPIELRCKTIEYLFPEIEQNALSLLATLHAGQIHIAYKRATEYAQLYPLIDINKADMAHLFNKNADLFNEHKECLLPISAYIRLTKNQCHALFHFSQQQYNTLLASPIIPQKSSININGEIYDILQQLLQTHKILISKIALPYLIVQKDPSWKDLVEIAKSSDCKKIVRDRWNRLHSAMLGLIGSLGFMQAAKASANLFFVTNAITLKTALCGALGTPAAAVLCCLLIHAHSSLDHYYKSNNQITLNVTVEDTNNNANQIGE